MNAKRWLILIGAAGITAAATGCKDQTARDEIKSVQDFIKTEGPLYKYLNQLADAVCDLEVKHSGAALDPSKRICVTGTPDKKAPPSYPPAP
jgi:hypothetical protein